MLVRGEHYPPKTTRKEENIHEISLRATERMAGVTECRACWPVLRIHLRVSKSVSSSFASAFSLIFWIFDVPIYQVKSSCLVRRGHTRWLPRARLVGSRTLAHTRSPLQSRQTVELIGRRRPISFPSSLLQPLAVSRAVFACESRCDAVSVS